MSVLTRASRLLSNPGRVISKSRDLWHRRRFRREVLRTRPLATAPDADAELHVFFGARHVAEAIGTLKSFARFAPDRLSLVGHEDGGISEADAALFARHLPGARLVRRRDADVAVGKALSDAGFPRCAELRRTFHLAPKLFDMAFYARARAVLVVDTDVLCFRTPTALLDAAAQPSDRWVDRYNEDMFDSYTWTIEQVREGLGLELRPRINSGMICYAKETLDYPLFERCLAEMPPVPDRKHVLEQTLYAISMSVRGAEPLPPDYDVCFRHATRGHDYGAWMRKPVAPDAVATQHYCCSQAHKAMYYEHFNHFVAPTLR